MIHAEIMAVGDEITSGQCLDTNSQWLSQQLGNVGIAVRFHTTVGDDLDSLTAAIQIALHRAPLVIISGGLGPTADDLTRHAIARAAARSLELRADALAAIEARFAERGQVMTPANQVQALFPVGSRIIPNPHGTAPGIDLDWSDDGHQSRLVALPGVPAELVQMWNETVEPAVVTLAGPGQVIRHHRIKCFGTGESHLESMLPDLIRRDRDPRVGITVHRATITLRVTAAGPDAATCRQLMQPTLTTIHQCLGGLVFGEEDDELEDAVVRVLAQRHQRLSVCEWGTQGLIARWLSAVDRSHVLQAALVVSGVDALEKLLSIVPSIELSNPSTEHPMLLRRVAETLRERCETDFALVTGPLPGPLDPHPQIGLALAGPSESLAVYRDYVGHPDVVLERAAKQALDLLRHYLLRPHHMEPNERET